MNKLAAIANHQNTNMPDINYHRPDRLRQYVSIYKHQFHAAGSWAKWLNVNLEKEIFDHGDYGNFVHSIPANAELINSAAWLDDNGNIWSFQSDFR